MSRILDKLPAPRRKNTNILKHKEKAEKIKGANILKTWGVPEYPGLIISITEGPEVIDDNLHMLLSAKLRSVELIHDNHFVFVNPPLRYRDEGVDNPKKAAKEMITQAVMKQIESKL